jgi:hypothetical protein
MRRITFGVHHLRCFQYQHPPPSTKGPRGREIQSSRRNGGSANSTSPKPRQSVTRHRKVHPSMGPERLVDIIKTLKAHVTIESLVSAYLNVSTRGHHMATLNTRRARFRNLLFNTTEVYEAISKAPSTTGEVVTELSSLPSQIRNAAPKFSYLLLILCK